MIFLTSVFERAGEFMTNTEYARIRDGLAALKTSSPRILDEVANLYPRAIHELPEADKKRIETALKKVDPGLTFCEATVNVAKDWKQSGYAKDHKPEYAIDVGGRPFHPDIFKSAYDQLAPFMANHGEKGRMTLTKAFKGERLSRDEADHLQKAGIHYHHPVTRDVGTHLLNKTLPGREMAFQPAPYVRLQ